MAQNKVIEIVHNNDKKDVGDYVVMVIAFILAFMSAVGCFLLTNEAIKLCAAQCSGENCKYVVEGIENNARNLFILIGCIVFMLINKKDATIRLAQKTARQIGTIFTSFKKGCSSDDNEKE